MQRINRTGLNIAILFRFLSAKTDGEIIYSEKTIKIPTSVPGKQIHTALIFNFGTAGSHPPLYVIHPLKRAYCLSYYFTLNQCFNKLINSDDKFLKIEKKSIVFNNN
jgi:hypothetical protein